MPNLDVPHDWLNEARNAPPAQRDAAMTNLGARVLAMNVQQAPRQGIVRSMLSNPIMRTGLLTGAALLAPQAVALAGGWGAVASGAGTLLSNNIFQGAVLGGTGMFVANRIFSPEQPEQGRPA